MGLLDWLSPALTVGTTAMAAQRNAQANNIATQQAQAAAQVKAYMDKRKAEDEHQRAMAETLNAQNKQANELAQIGARGSAETDTQTTVARAAQKAKNIANVQTWLRNPKNAASPQGQRLQAQIAAAGGDLSKADLGEGWEYDVTEGGKTADDERRMEQIKYEQGQSTGRNNADIAARAALQTQSDAAALERAKLAASGVGGGAGGQARLQAQAFIPEIEGVAKELDSITPQFLAREMSTIPGVGNYMTTDKGRQFNQRAKQFINNVIYAKSGKAITEGEFQRLYSVYVPEPGDDQATLLQKSEARQLFMQGLYTVAGRGRNVADILNAHGFQGAGGASAAAPGVTQAPPAMLQGKPDPVAEARAIIERAKKARGTP